MDEAKRRIQVKLNKDVADKANKVLESLGLTQTTAITMLFKRIVATGSFPISLDLTDEEKAVLDFKENTKDVPKHVFKDNKEVEEWINSDEY